MAERSEDGTSGGRARHGIAAREEPPWLARARRPGMTGALVELIALSSLFILFLAREPLPDEDIIAIFFIHPLCQLCLPVVMISAFWALIHHSEIGWSERLEVRGDLDLVAADVHRALMDRRMGAIWPDRGVCEVYPRRYALGRAPDRWLISRPVRVDLSTSGDDRTMIRLTSTAIVPRDGLLITWRSRSRKRRVYSVLRMHFGGRRRYLGDGIAPTATKGEARRAPSPGEPFTSYSHDTGMYEHAVDVFCPRCGYEFTARRTSRTRRPGTGEAVCPSCRMRFPFRIDPAGPATRSRSRTVRRIGGSGLKAYRTKVACPDCGVIFEVEQMASRVSDEGLAVCPACHRGSVVPAPPGTRGGPEGVGTAPPVRRGARPKKRAPEKRA